MEDSTPDKYVEVTKKALHGIGWNYLSFGLGKVLNIVTVSILAHVLTPEHFGLVALATLTTDYLSVLKELGLDSALIQRRHDIERSTNVAFTMNMAAGAILSLLTFIVAPYAALIFHEPQVVAIIRWVGLTFILSAFGSINSALLKRELNFRNKLIPDLAAILVKAVVSIGMAMTGFGVWSLVAGQLLGTAVGSLLYWVITPWRPKFAWDSAIGKELFSYGFPMMGSDALSVWEQNFDYLIIGIIYTPVQLGIYTLAYRLPQTLILSMLWLIASVLFPTFSSLQDQKDKLKRSFLSSLKYVELLVTPLCLGLCVAAEPLILVLFGKQWVDAIPILRALSLYAWAISMGYHVGDVYKAIGRTDILLKMSIPMFVVRLTLLWIGAQYSLLGVGIAHLAAASIESVVRYFVAAHFLQVTLREIIRELTSLVCGAVLVIFALPVLFLTAQNAPITQLICVVIAGAIGYLGAAWVIERSSVLNTLKIFGFRQSEA